MLHLLGCGIVVADAGSKFRVVSSGGTEGKVNITCLLVHSQLGCEEALVASCVDGVGRHGFREDALGREFDTLVDAGEVVVVEARSFAVGAPYVEGVAALVKSNCAGLAAVQEHYGGHGHGCALVLSLVDVGILEAVDAGAVVDLGHPPVALGVAAQRGVDGTVSQGTAVEGNQLVLGDVAVAQIGAALQGLALNLAAGGEFDA